VNSVATTAPARKRRWFIVSAIAALIVAALAGFWFLRGRAAHPAGIAGHKAIAVLYFSNLSRDPSLNWLDNGLTDMLTTNLAQVKGLEVLSTERVMSAVQRASKDGKSMDPAQAQNVARDAGADAYITGALLKIGPTQLRLDVRAQDTGTGQILFSDKLEGQDVQSIFGMVDRLTASIAGSFLPASEVPQKAPEIEQASTSNVEAYRHYQLGIDYARRFLTKDAIRELEEAVRLDPQFALAYLRLSDEYSFEGDARRGTETAVKVEQFQSRLPRYEQLSLQVLKAARSRDPEAELAARAAIEPAAADKDQSPATDLDLGKIDLTMPLKNTKIARDILYAPPSMPALDLLAKMQATRIHLALIIDEYGGSDGLVSMEDLVELIVGDIADEHDEAETAAVTRQSDGSFIATGRASLDDVRAVIGEEFDVGEAAQEVDTLGGYLVMRAGHVPVRGELVPGPATFEAEVLDADPRRVKRVKIYRSKDRRPGGSRDLPQALRPQVRATPPRDDAGKPSPNAPPP